MASKAVIITDYRSQVPGALEQGAWKFPVINSSARSGKAMYWSIYVRAFYKSANPRYAQGIVSAFTPIRLTYLDNKSLPADIAAWYKVDSAYEGSEPKVSAPTIVETGKNIGKTNETNVVCQAIRDALGLYTKQVSKNTPAVAGEGCEFYPPMLAKVFNSDVRIKTAHAVQRKFDGIRTVACLCDDRIILYSRNLKTYPGHDYLREDIIGMARNAAARGLNVYFDGELYKHGVPLQQTSGDGRRGNSVVTQYNYMLYDLFIPESPEMPYIERKALLEELIAEHGEFAHVQLVETYIVSSNEEIDDLYAKFLKEGFEGAMIRTLDGKYVYSRKGYHCKELQKLKPAYDDEFLIVGWTVGEKGKAAGALMIICETEEGKQFNVTPAMQIVDRIELAKKMPMIEDNGKTYYENVWDQMYITVQYASLSTDRIPQQPRTRMTTRVDEPTAADAAKS